MIGAREFAVLIPAYKPGLALLSTIRSLLAAKPDLRIVVVDDGSGEAYYRWFDRAQRMGAEVVTHPANRGKGAALKTGFTYLTGNHPGCDVVCADADGQHTAEDILAVGRRLLAEHRQAVVLGVRDLAGEGGGAPLRSRFGNALTRSLFGLLTGQALGDTQTGLRGIPGNLLPWATGLPGDRYDYELRMLLSARRKDVELISHPISTIYLDDNSTSHFRPIVDSVRVYLPMLGFLLSSLTAFAIDTVALLVLNALTGSLLTAVVGARLTSGVVNYTLNRMVLKQPGAKVSKRSSLAKYAVLAGCLLALNYALLRGLTTVMPLLAAKVATEVVLFTVSYVVQRYLIFRARPAETGSTTETPVGKGVAAS